MSQFSQEQILKELQDLYEEGESILLTAFVSSGNRFIDSGAFNAWRAKLLMMMNSRHISAPEIRDQINRLPDKYLNDAKSLQCHISALIESIQKGYVVFGDNPAFDWNAELENIFNRFHKVVRQLRTRYKDRQTLSVSDEYDVQDLLHALLVLYFDDVRAEEWTPSYAGGASRMDFLLKDCQTVVEVKKTRQSMTAKDLGEQLIIDKEKYKSHPDCKMLYCFVYDPDGFLGNPVGIKKDLEAGNEDFIKVIIKPD